MQWLQKCYYLHPNLPNDSLSVYFLHPSESPGQLLVTIPLSELNYHTWSCSMIMALEAKNKTGFVNGSILEPALGDAFANCMGKTHQDCAFLDN